MARTVDQLDQLLLHALCEDITPFEVLADKLRPHLQPDQLPLLPGRLLSLITMGWVDSYLLHAEPPYLTPADSDAEGVYRHWFFISEDGLEHLNQKPMQHHEWRSPSARDRRSRVHRELRHKNLGC
jgi:hypothetical protein